MTRNSGLNKLWSIAYPIMIVLIADMAVNWLAEKLLSMIVYSEGFSNLRVAYSIMLSGLVLLVVLPFFIRIYKKDSISFGTGKYLAMPSFANVAKLVVVGAMATWAVSGIATLTGYFINGYVSLDSSIEMEFVLQLVISVIIAPIAEETIYRGVIYNRIKFNFNKTGAIVFSSVIFGLMHSGIEGRVGAVIGGVLLCLVYEKYQTLTASMLYHMGFNLFVLISNTFGWQELLYSNGPVAIVPVMAFSVVALVWLLYNKKK